MRILLFTDSFFPQINGLVTAVDTIANEISRDNEVYVIIPKNHLNKYQTKYNLIPVFSIPFILFPEYRISSIFSLKVLILLFRKRFDIIHTHTPFSLGVMGLILGKLFKIPVVHTYHTFFEEYLHYVNLSPRTGRWLVKLISRWYCNLCDKIIVPSLMMKRVLLGYGVRKEIRVIPTGINIKKFMNGNRLKWRKKMHIPSTAKILLYVGRIAKEKNIFFLLDCFKNIRKKIDNVYLLLVGDGPLRKEVSEYLKKFNFTDYVKITGYVKPAELKHIYACADVFVFTSITETQGLVILEAASAGVPIVAVSKRGTKFILPKKKIIGISPTHLNRGEITNEVLYYLKNLNRDRICQNLRNFIQHYTIHYTIKNLMDVYKSVIADASD